MGLILSEREVGRPCLCGALDCRSCGPAQGYPVERDDDRDGVVGPTSCDQPVKFDGVTADDMARAMEICQTTAESPASAKDRKWGIISAQLLLDF